jgi:uncharacterized protein (TIGR02270 family)
MLSLAITGTGLITAVGRNTLETFTSVRAGLSRFTELTGLDCPRRGQVGAVLPYPLCDDMEERLLEIGVLAAIEAVESAGISTKARLTLALCLPSHQRPESRSTFGRDYVRALEQALDRSEGSIYLEELPFGGAAFVQGLNTAMKGLSEGRSDCVLIGAADSLLRPRILQWLEASDRLKTEGNSDGLIPGEAAVCVLVESVNGAKARDVPIMARIDGFGFGHEPGFYFSEHPCLATGVTEAMRQAMVGAKVAKDFCPEVLSDLNGESYRAKEWAVAELRVFSEAPTKHLHPADCFGDVGAAMGAALLGLAAVGIWRRVTTTPVMVLASSEGPERAVAILRSPYANETRPSSSFSPRTASADSTPWNSDEAIDSVKVDNQFAEDLAWEHLEGASFLWRQRDRAASAPHYDLVDLARLDDRLDAHLDGLRISRVFWSVYEEAFSLRESGQVFIAGILTFEKRDETPIQDVLDKGDTSPEHCRGLISALGWLPHALAAGHIPKLLESDSRELRRVGLAGSAVHRLDPGRPLVDALNDSDTVLRARALKACGELGRRDLLPILLEHLRAEDQKSRFYAAWSAALLGSNAGAPVLRDVAQAGGPYSERACSLALQRMSVADGHSWNRELASQPERQRLSVIGAGALGDPAAVPWLNENMMVPELARVAGESFTMITGVDIAYENLEGEWPEGFEAGPTENPEDEDVALDPDEDLPWPNPELIEAWWNNNKGAFRSGTRYLLGKPISGEQCQHVLRYGYQRQRAAAAIELAMLQPGQPLFEVRAPGFRQKRLLGVK